MIGERRLDGTNRYYLTDHVRSVIGAAEDTGTRTHTYGYGPYGEFRYGTTGADQLRWRYTGAWLDAANNSGDGFHKIGLRYHDNPVGRWTQTDPLERVINPSQPAEAQPYTYAGCNPVNQTDPTGAAFDLGCAASAAGVVASAIGFGVALGGAIVTTGPVGFGAAVGMATGAFSWATSFIGTMVSC